MKLRLSFLVVMMGFAVIAKAQDEIDVSKLLADTKTFIFDDSKSTVKEYIYSSLESKTSCCGSDRIYLEVKIDPSGYVLQVKSLTGKNDCFKQSAADIVKNIRWNATGFKGPKSIYFEIKPDIKCSGDRPNTYAAVPIVNNELLSEDGTKLYTKGTPMGDGEKADTESTSTASEDAAGSQEEAAQSNDAAGESTAAVEVEDKPASPPPPPVKAEVEDAVASNEVKSEETTSDEAATEELPTTTAEQPSFTEPVASETEESQEATTPNAAEEELAQLKEQMAEMKKAKEEEIAELQAKEDERRRKIEARRERARKIRERREQLAAEKEAQNDDEYFTDGDDDDDDEEDASLTEDQRLADEIRRLQEQRQQLQDERNAADDERRRASEDHSRYGRDIFRVEEEIKRIEEERMRAREQAELARLEEERRRIEDEKRQQEDQLQRLMDEIQRLRDESDSRLAEITRQGQDINDLQQEKVTMEDRIETERVQREQQTMAELRMRELELQSDVVGAGPSPDFSQFLQAENDSSRTLALLNQIALLQSELNRVSAQVSATGQPGASNPVATNSQPVTGTAATDESWKDTDFKDPNAPEGTYNNAPKPGPKPNPGPARGGTDNSSVTTTGHGNSSGPMFANLEYGQGSESMKLFITDRLREGGVCGLAQTFCEISVSPEGKVVGYKILRANSPLVMALMPNILQSLEFNADNIKFTQISYIELKADLYCGDEKVDLQNVQPYVKPGN